MGAGRAPNDDQDGYRGARSHAEPFHVRGALRRALEHQLVQRRRPRRIVVAAVDRDEMEEVDGLVVLVEVGGLRSVRDHGPELAAFVAPRERKRPRREIAGALAELLDDWGERDPGQLGGEGGLFLAALLCGGRGWGGGGRGSGGRGGRDCGCGAECGRRGWFGGATGDSRLCHEDQERSETGGRQHSSLWSGRPDLNRGPRGPKPRALPG